MNEFIWECFLVNSHHSQKYLIVCTNHLCNNDPLLRWHDAARQHKIHILDHSMYLHLVHDYDYENDDYHHVHLHLVQLLHYFSHLSTCQRYNRYQFKILSKQKDNSFLKIKPKLLLLLNVWFPKGSSKGRILLTRWISNCFRPSLPFPLSPGCRTIQGLYHLNYLRINNECLIFTKDLRSVPHIGHRPFCLKIFGKKSEKKLSQSS